VFVKTQEESPANRRQGRHSYQPRQKAWVSCAKGPSSAESATHKTGEAGRWPATAYLDAVPRPSTWAGINQAFGLKAIAVLLAFFPIDNQRAKNNLSA